HGADEPPVRAVALDDAPLVVVEGERVLDALDRAREPVGGDPSRRLRPSSLRDVADRRRRGLAALRVERTQAHLDRDLRAVLAPPGELEAGAHRAHRRLVLEAGDVRAVLGPEALRDEGVQRLAEELVA